MDMLSDLLDHIDINMTALIIYIIVGIFIWLAIRELKLWYWRINDIVNEQKHQTEVLNKILTEMHAQKRTTPTNTNKEKSTP